MSPTANQYNAIAAVELAVAEAERLVGQPLSELASRDAEGTTLPVVTIVTDNGGPFRSHRFEAFIATRAGMSAPASARPARTAHASVGSAR
jgi:hypothetical protein